MWSERPRRAWPLPSVSLDLQNVICAPSPYLFSQQRRQTAAVPQVPLRLCLYHRLVKERERDTQREAAVMSAASQPSAREWAPEAGNSDAQQDTRPDPMLSLVLIVFFVHLAIYLVNTIGAATIDSLVRTVLLALVTFLERHYATCSHLRSTWHLAPTFYSRCAIELTRWQCSYGPFISNSQPPHQEMRRSRCD